MKISIRHIADHGTIAAAIEAIAADHDTLADKVAEPYKISDSTTRFFTLGINIGTTEDELKAAAIFALEWHGDSEADREPLEYRPTEELDADGDPTGLWQVVPSFGSQSRQNYEGDEVESTHATHDLADARATELNTQALANMIAAADWYDLPAPVVSIYFPGFEPGNYPQSRRARLTAILPDNTTVEVCGFGNARYLSESHSADALADAAAKLIAALTPAA